MLTIILPILMVALSVGVRGECATLNRIDYQKKRLQTVYYPVFMSFNDDTNELYFCFDTDQDRNIAKLNFNTNKTFNFPRVGQTTDFAVDHKNEEVYVGTFSGIYKYSIKNGRIIRAFCGGEDKHVRRMFFKTYLYYTTWDLKLYVLKNGTHSLVDELKDKEVKTFIIDDDNVMYYSNNEGIYRQVVGSNNAMLIGDNLTFRVVSFSIDKSGGLYVCSHEGLFALNKISLVFTNLKYKCQDVKFAKDGRVFMSMYNIDVFTPANCWDN